MRKLVVICLSCLVLFFFSNNVSAAFWSSTPLLMINEQEYTVDDYKNWWHHWNDKNELQVPETLDTYIDFQLFVQQALAMEFDSHPSFLRATEVYLKFRSLMSLKYEEVDSKLNIQEEEYRAYFEEVYAPIWKIQVLAFEKKEDADKTYEKLLPFNGVEAGRLIFADFQGENSIPFQEAEVSPYKIIKNKRQAWLPIIRSLKPGYMAEPFLEKDKGKYILLRLIDITQPDESLYLELEQRIHHEVFKRNVAKFTNELHERLVEKYGVSIDETLLDEIVDIEKEYSDDFLEKVMLVVGDTEVTAGVFIRNLKQEIARRPGVDFDFARNLVKSDLIRQILIEKESLSRHYEEHEPLKKTWEFYRQNQLRLALTRELAGREKIEDGELLEYYNKNKASYEFPAKERYVLIVNDRKSVEKAWTDIVHGNDINKIAIAYGLNAEVTEANSDAIAPDIATEISKLNPGGVSKPFIYGDDYAIVKLIARIPARVHEFEDIKTQLEAKLIKEKADNARNAYLKEARSRSSIMVNDEKWVKLRKELQR